MMLSEMLFTLTALADAYSAGTRPADVMREAYRRIRAAEDPAIFISLQDEAKAVAEAEALGPFDPARPLWGVPFGVMDNIDVAGLRTSAACPDFAYGAAGDAAVVARLRAAGAIPLGKTNLDQFATGLVGVRSPFGVPRNAIDPAIVPGGSSSGSAVAVARGIVAFALGTDTAGSGRVPAVLNNIVGLKPTLGALSATGVVPACRTLDTVSVFAQTVADAWTVFAAAAGFDAADPYSRRIAVPPLSQAPSLRIAVPSPASRPAFTEPAQDLAFGEVLESLRQAGHHVAEIDFTPFHAVAAMLYEGAWVAERMSVIEALYRRNPDAILPVTRKIIGAADRMSATDAFRGLYRLADLRRAAEAAMAGFDLLAVPSIPAFVTLEDIAADPVGPNSRLGTWTNFVNLLDLCGVAVPTGPRPDGRPGGVTLLARAGQDARAAGLALSLERLGGRTLGATGWPVPEAALPEPAAAPDEIALAVCGAHMAGLPLNAELTRRGGRFLRATETAPAYALHALAGGPPFRPGLVRVGADGARIALEVWALPKAAFGDFVSGIPAPLGIGTVELSDGGRVKGFLCETAGLTGARDITGFGGWRAFLAAG